MKIIISPAKKMNQDIDSLEYKELPTFIEETKDIMEWIQKLSLTEAKKLWGCNDAIAELNYKRFQEMDLYQNLTPAILSYEGIQYQYMAPTVFEENMLEYVQKHLRILSGFYGVLKPMDGVTPYRLEMQAKAKINGQSDLYKYWNRKLYDEIIDKSRVIINLASKEYSKCIEKYLSKEVIFITCIFAERVGERIVQKGTYAKMARGEMVRFMAENAIDVPEDIKKFNRLGYEFQPELSRGNEYIFLKRTEE